MKSKTISIRTIDKEGDIDLDRPFDTITEAREFFETSARSQSYWEQYAESSAYPLRIDSIQLVVDEEIRDDFFPEFKERGAWVR